MVYITVVVLYYLTCTLFPISNCCAHVKAIGMNSLRSYTQRKCIELKVIVRPALGQTDNNIVNVSTIMLKHYRDRDVLMEYISMRRTVFSRYHGHAERIIREKSPFKNASGQWLCVLSAPSTTISLNISSNYNHSRPELLELKDVFSKKK
jgi:hypothetical protein